MKLFLNGKIKVPVIKCQRPKFSNRKCWDSRVINICGEDNEAWQEMNYGKYIYFINKEHTSYYKIPTFSSYDDDLKHPEFKYDIEIFENPKPFFTNKLIGN